MTQNNFNNNNSNQEQQGFSADDSSQKADLSNQDLSQDNILKSFQQKINELEQKNSDLNDKLLRSLAELDNVRRRSREELEKASKFAISSFVGELVVIVENFLMASSNAPNNEIEQIPAIKNYATAISLTEKELLKILEKNQVKRLYPLNEKFDHNFHEAIAQIESDAEEGTVVQVIQAGYSIENRLIRPALVGVAKAKN